MQVVGQVYSTHDYSLFKTLKGNRNVVVLHVKRLQESFKQGYLLSPIIVNHNYEIIDGQHRFNAAKELNLPINYIICNNYSLKEVQLLNTNMKNWGKLDYLNGYCDLGYPEYLKFREFTIMFPKLGIISCEVILTDSLGTNTSRSDLKGVINKRGNYYVRNFAEGNLKIPDFEKSIDYAKKIMAIAPYYGGFNKLLFIKAMIGIFRNENYSHSKFIERLASNPTALKDCANVGQYKLLIEDIYNYRSRVKVSLRF